eukprot:4467518-Prymnesium_polylepis.1
MFSSPPATAPVFALLQARCATRPTREREERHIIAGVRVHLDGQRVCLRFPRFVEDIRSEGAFDRRLRKRAVRAVDNDR